jgi:hypothetical protein
MDNLKHLLKTLQHRVLHRVHVWRNQHKEQTVENNKTPVMYTEEQLMARLKFFIGICLSLTLFGIVFVVLYSLIFVTQPLNAISPIDSKFFELIIPIATFLTGTLSGIMLASPGDNEAKKQAMAAANKGWDKVPTPISTGGSSNGSTSPTTGFTAFSSSPSGFGAAPGGFGSPAPTTGFGSQPLGGGVGSSAAFGAPAFGPAVVAGFGGKPAPAPADQPAI